VRDKTNNTSAFSIFGAASSTSTNGSNSRSNSKVTSTVDITVDVTGLIAKGKELLEDESLNTSSGKFKSFRALGKELLKDNPNLADQFEQTTNSSGIYKIINSEDQENGLKINQELSHKYAVEAIQRGIDFLEMLS
jgi:hypothetical protein